MEAKEGNTCTHNKNITSCKTKEILKNLLTTLKSVDVSIFVFGCGQKKLSACSKIFEDYSYKVSRLYHFPFRNYGKGVGGGG